ncbi:MAG: hypothetical protein ABEI77_08060 [Halorientalis sp.]
MQQSLRTAVRDRLTLRQGLYVLGLLAILRLVLDVPWKNVLVIVVAIVVFEAIGVARVLPGVDERYFGFLLGAIVLGLGIVDLWRAREGGVGVLAVAVGCWIVLDTLYNFRAGHHPGDSSAADTDSSDVLMRIQVGHLVADELKDGPRTVPELAAACDLTESRVRDALEYHERAGTAYEQGEQWHLDESNTGLWAFVRNNARRILARIARPFRLFVPN